MDLHEIDNRVDALIHTSVEDARCSLHGGEPIIVIERALAKLEGMPGHTTRRKMFAAYLKRNQPPKKGSKP